MTDIGWTCPVCCRVGITRVMRTMHNPDGSITRYRECVCGESVPFSTLEQVADATNRKNGKTPVDKMETVTQN